MANSKSVPMVAIVGRANVGKSSLFNALVGQRRAIVAAEPGTTRDSVAAKASYGGKDWWLVDTAGLKNPEDDFELSIQEQISEAAAAAAAILVVVEAAAAISEEDRRVARLALKSGKPVVLAINKIDQAGRADLSVWQRLGIKSMASTSATQKTGLDELLNLLAGQLPQTRIKEAPDRLKLALVGRPNVGKSSLFNSLIAKQKSIVAPKAGTTRDVNREVVRYEGREIELLDTAGIRRRGKIERGVEQFSVLRALAAIEEADIVLLVMEASELNVQLDQKLAGLAKDAGKGLVLVVSKWDQVDKAGSSQDRVSAELGHHFAFVPWAPLVFTSAISGQNVTRLFELALQIDAARQTKIATPQLNNWLNKTTREHLPAGLKNHQPKLNYIVQETDQAWPNFKIFGRQLKFLHWSYRRYLERQFREQWPLTGTPIKFWFIDKAPPADHTKG